MDFVEADMAHSHKPFYVVQNLINTLLELEECTSSEREIKIQSYIKNDELREELSLLNDLLGTHIPGHAKLIHMDDITVSEHQHLLLFEIVHQVVLKEPCIFAVENAHNIDFQSWNFLEDLMRESHAVLVMTMKPLSAVTTIPESGHRMISDSNTVEIDLGGLPPDVMVDMACQFLDVTCIPYDLYTIIREKSHGVASWCEQLVKDMLASNSIKVVSDKDVVIINDDDLSDSGENAPHQRTRSPSVFPDGQPSLVDVEVKPGPKPRPESAVVSQSTTSAVVSGSGRPISALRRKSVNLVRAVSAFRRPSVGSDESTPKRRQSWFRRFSLQPNDTDKESKSRRTSISFDDDAKKTKQVKIYDDADEEIFGDDVILDDVGAIPDMRTENSGEAQEEGERVPKILQPIPRYFLPSDSLVYANPSAIINDINHMCIATPGVDLKRIPVPESLREMVLARFDRLPPLEKVVIKCSSILGDSFPRDLVAAIVPKSVSDKVDLAFYHLLKLRILECATLSHQHQNAHNHHGFIDTTHAHAQHHHHHHHHHVTNTMSDIVPCGCYANESSKVLNLTKYFVNNKLKKPCLYLKFTNSNVQETTYALWLKKQRESLHQKTATFLESQAHKCRSCGGGAFLSSTMMSSKPDNKPTERSTSIRPHASGRSGVHFKSDAEKRRSSRLIREKVQAEGVFCARVADRQTQNESEIRAGIGIGRPRNLTIGTDVMSMQKPNLPEKPRERKIQCEGIGLSLIPATINIATQDDDEQELTTKDMSIKAIRKNVSQTLLEHDTDRELPILPHDPLPSVGLSGVDMSKCECAEVLASIFPQLVTHWRAGGNKLKTFRYLTESGAAALATGCHMQALSYLHQVQNMLNKGDHFVANSEEKARVESLIGQVMLGMNRLDAALVHLYAALKELGVPHPKSRIQIAFCIRKEIARHKLYRTFPAIVQRNAINYDSGLLERAQCFFHISHVFHAEGQHKAAFMAALQELNTAERIGDNFHLLITAFTSVIECSELVSWKRYALECERIASKKFNEYSMYLSVDDFITVSNFYSVVNTSRLSKGLLKDAAEAGFKSLSLANKLNDHMLKINGIPSLAVSLLLMSRLDDCHDVLKELNYSSREKDDVHGRALYFCSCFDLILETGYLQNNVSYVDEIFTVESAYLTLGGHKLESVNECVQFTASSAIDPRLTWDLIVKYYLNCCFALWYARCENWEEAEMINKAAQAMQPILFEVVMAGRGFVKRVEYSLLLLRKDPKNKAQKQLCRKLLSTLFQISDRFVVLRPRYYHLRAYYFMLSGKISKAKVMLATCNILSSQMGMLMESEWAILNKHEWFDRNVTQMFYTGYTKFPLPKVKQEHQSDTALDYDTYDP